MCSINPYRPAPSDIPPPRDPAELLAEAERRKRGKHKEMEFIEDTMR